MVFMWKFLDSGRAKKSGVLTRAVIKLAWVQENRHAYKRTVKEPGQKVVEILPNENYPRGHYDLVASFNPPCWSWNGMYLSTPWRIRFFF
jgi:hypothetical protein